MSKDTTQDQINLYRARIKDMVRRIPASVNGGSYETAVAFKKLATQALKAAESSKPKLSVLTQMHQQLSSYY